jgi:hypothetical protein
MLEAKTPSSA